MVLVFDGACNLCGGFTRFLLKRDRKARIRFATIQSPFGAARMREEGLDPDDPASILLLRSDKALRESDAILSVIASLGSGWRLVGLARIVPAALRNLVYRWIARNRYRWFGRTSHCALPDPAWQGRFLS